MTLFELQMVHRLLLVMELCRRNNTRFRPLFLEATRQFNKEVREEALSKPLP